jgi:lipopolysaccharide biosynthesis glycosyltransferase
MDNSMNIALAFSQNWSKYVAIEMFALFITNYQNQNIKVYLLSDELLYEDLERFDNVCALFNNCTYEYFNVLDLYNNYIPSGINVNSRFTKYALYRLFLPMLTDVDKILYIDTDAIVIDDIHEFYNLDFENNLMFGCEDTGIQPNYKTQIGMSEENPYINSGVCLMNLKVIRDSKLYEWWINTANTKWFLGLDQDILNISCEGRIGIVHPQWNTCISTDLEHGEPIKLMHFTGNKPWNDKTVPNYNIWEVWEALYNECLS